MTAVISEIALAWRAARRDKGVFTSLSGNAGSAQVIPFRLRPKPPAAITAEERQTEAINAIIETLLTTPGHLLLRDGALDRVADSWRRSWGDGGAPLIQTEPPRRRKPKPAGDAS